MSRPAFLAGARGWAVTGPLGFVTQRTDDALPLFWRGTIGYYMAEPLALAGHSVHLLPPRHKRTIAQ